MEPCPRDDLIDKVTKGLLPPEEAEAEALRLGLGPLAQRPDPAAFDPMAEPYWSLPMAVAWLAYRTPEPVRENWNAYRAEFTHWIFRKTRIGFQGEGQKGHLLESLRPTSLTRLRVTEKTIDRSGRDQEYTRTVDNAILSLMASLKANTLSSTGIDVLSGEREPIPSMLWNDLEFDRVSTESEVLERMHDSGTRPRFRHVRIERDAILVRWNIRPPPLVYTLPEIVRPDGGGHMALFFAALWIATKGGALRVDPYDLDIWKEAYRELMDQISSNDVQISGMNGNEREVIDGVVFAGCKIDYPFYDTPMDIMFSDEYVICSYPYVDDVKWRQGYDDAFENRHHRRWRQLMVRKADIRRIWPFETVLPAGTGAPGRPSSMHLVEDEFERRAALGEHGNRLSEEARSLEKWFRQTHPTAPPATATTIENRIRSRFNALKTPRN
jgi:hypothetical protein